MTMAATNNSGTTLICTTAGFIKVDIDRFYTDQSSIEQSSSELAHAGQHCPFCNLYDTDININVDYLPYPKPDDRLELHYQNVLPLGYTKPISKHAPLRAPPVYL